MTTIGPISLLAGAAMMAMAALPDVSTVTKAADDTSKVGMMALGLMVLSTAIVCLYRDNRKDRAAFAKAEKERYDKIAERDELFTGSLRDLTKVLSGQREAFHALTASSGEVARLMAACRATQPQSQPQRKDPT